MVLSGHKSLQNLFLRLPLRQQSLHKMQQLTEGLAGKRIALLANGMRVVFSKGEPLRFLAPLPGQTEAATALRNLSGSGL